ncbi:MAG: hypothetical protein IJ498_06915 [Akkermansia sp.]|nr:hypothetical protein [Akkermansia sp.]
MLSFSRPLIKKERPDSGAYTIYTVSLSACPNSFPAGMKNIPFSSNSFMLFLSYKINTLLNEVNKCETNREDECCSSFKSGGDASETPPPEFGV